MLKGLMTQSGRLSKKSPSETRGAQGDPSESGSGTLGRGRGAPGPKAGDEASMGTGGREARCPLQARLRVDLSLRLRAPPERKGLLADPAHGQRGVVLDGARCVRQRGGSRRAQARPFGGGSGRLAHRQRGRDPGRDTSRVPALRLPGATAGGEVVAANQRGGGQWAL